jgi:hypothetical protein
VLEPAFLGSMIRDAIPSFDETLTTPPAGAAAAAAATTTENTSWMDEYDSAVRRDKRGSRKGKKGGRLARQRTKRKRKN